MSGADFMQTFVSDYIARVASPDDRTIGVSSPDFAVIAGSSLAPGGSERRGTKGAGVFTGNPDRWRQNRGLFEPRTTFVSNIARIHQ
jgi:hypothetical protein